MNHEKQKQFFLELRAKIKVNPQSIAEIVNWRDFYKLLEEFINDFDNYLMRGVRAQANAGIENELSPDLYFWRAVDYFYNSRWPSPDFRYILVEDPTVRAAELKKNRHLRDVSILTNDKKIILFDEASPEYISNILFFADAGKIFDLEQFKGKTYVRLSNFGLPKNNKIDFWRRIFLIDTINGFYDGEWQILPPMTGDESFIKGFCIDKPPLKETYHGGLFPENNESFLSDFWVKTNISGEVESLPKHIPTPAEKKSLNLPKFTNSDRNILNFFAETAAKVQLSRAISPASFLLEKKDLEMRLPIIAFHHLMANNFLNLGVRFLIGEVGFEVAEQAGIGYPNWLNHSRWHGGLSKKISEIFVSSGGSYLDIKQALWNRSGLRRVSLINRMASHPNFNYYRNMNHETNQPAEAYMRPPIQTKIDDFVIGEKSFVNSAHELRANSAFDFPNVSDEMYVWVMLAAPILTQISHEFAVFGLDESLYLSYSGDQMSTIKNNPNFNYSIKAGKNAVEKLNLIIKKI